MKLKLNKKIVYFWNLLRVLVYFYLWFILDHEWIVVIDFWNS